MVAIDQNSNVLFARRFPLCPKHGILGDEKDEILGHHATHWNPLFKDWFPPEVQKSLFDKLSGNERQEFISMREGRRRPDWTLLEEWLKKIKNRCAGNDSRAARGPGKKPPRRRLTGALPLPD